MPFVISSPLEQGSDMAQLCLQPRAGVLQVIFSEGVEVSHSCRKGQE